MNYFLTFLIRYLDDLAQWPRAVADRPCQQPIKYPNRLRSLTHSATLTSFDYPERRLLRQHRQHRLHDRCLLSDASKVALIAPRPMTVGSTDGADGTDANSRFGESALDTQIYYRRRYNLKI